MKLSELFDQLKTCQSNPDVFAGFDTRPMAYELVEVRFEARIEAGTLEDFDRQLRGIKGPTRVVLIAHVPEQRKP